MSEQEQLERAEAQRKDIKPKRKQGKIRYFTVNQILLTMNFCCFNLKK